MFVVASARNGFDPAAVLFEFDGVRRDSSPSREAGKESARGVESSVAVSSGHGYWSDAKGRAATLRAQDSISKADTIITLAHGQGGAEVATDRAPTLTCIHEAPIAAYPAVTHSLRAEGFDASEDGTGRGTPLVPVAFSCKDYGGDASVDLSPTLRSMGHTESHPNGGGQVAVAIPLDLRNANRDPEKHDAMNRQGVGVGVSGDPAHTVTAQFVPGVAIAIQDVHAMNKAQNGRGWNDDTSYTDDTHATQGVAVSVALRGREGGATAELGDEVQHCLRASGGGGDKPHVLAGIQVRRLTPTECERLQGFPTVSEKLIIEACLDPQNQSVHAVLKCLRWQNNAWPADGNELALNAKTAAAVSSTRQASQEPLAALHVRMHFVDELLAIHSAGKLIWSANGAATSRKYLPHTLTESTVQELARLQREVAKTIIAGRAESHRNIRLSFPAASGATSVEKSGQETKVNANGAVSGQKRAMFITSDLGLITTCSDSTAATLCCSVLRAIAGCIPTETLPETFSVEFTVETPYTAIPWKRKPATECPDGPRYKALGNSWAVPVVRWIGRRIAEAVARVPTTPVDDTVTPA